MINLRTLPKVRDSWSYLYVDRCRVDREAKAIAVHDERGKVPVPCASLGLLMLGPGTTITHAAVQTLAENGCLVAWVGESGVRMYATGLGETRSSRRLAHQSRMFADPTTHLETVVRLYRMRFGNEPIGDYGTLQQLRGREGIRVRAAYERAAKVYGVTWRGRAYKASEWTNADPVNRALSAANSCLYGVCHAAIVAAGYTPALGFIHSGKMLSFVYDIADLYKTEIGIPAAFRAAAEGPTNIESRTRAYCRDLFYRRRLLSRIVPDISKALADEPQEATALEVRTDTGELVPAWLWDPDGDRPGGTNYADAGDAPEAADPADDPDGGWR
ncbi:MAG: type I-E CRISPR-associated endonuclease Cas1e [Dehalococcoidia bacterium]